MRFTNVLTTTTTTTTETESDSRKLSCVPVDDFVHFYPLAVYNLHGQYVVGLKHQLLKEKHGSCQRKNISIISVDSSTLDNLMEKLICRQSRNNRPFFEAPTVSIAQALELPKKTTIS